MPISRVMISAAIRGRAGHIGRRRLIAMRHFATIAIFFLLSLSSTPSSAQTDGELPQNSATCLDGRALAPCERGSLDADARRRLVLLAAQSENLRTCLTARDQVPCDKGRQAKELGKPRPPEARAPTSATQATPAGRAEHVRRASSSECESGHWVDSVSEDGIIIELEDGSIWEVDIVGAIDAALWVPTTEIVACEGKLINIENNETVSATRTE